MHRDTILYAEDDANDLFLVERAFEAEEMPHVLRVVVDGARAIAYLSGEGEYGDRATHPLPALVLLDLKLPQLDGLEVLRWIRGNSDHRGLPVVMFSNSFLERDVANAYLLGANCFIVKPFGMEELREVARFLKAWLRHATLPPANEEDWVALTPHDLRQHWPSRRRRAA